MAAPIVWDRDSEIAPTRGQVLQWLQEERQLNLSDPNFQRGLQVLEQFLASLIPKETSLFLNYPIPFNPETWIPYHLSSLADNMVSIHLSMR